MAVEARHISLFPPQLLCNREMMNPIEADTYLYNTQMGYGVPLSGTTSTAETLLPIENAQEIQSVLSSRIQLLYSPIRFAVPSPFLARTSLFQIQQQQLDTDCLISQHMEKVRMEIEERRKRHARRLLEAIETGMMKRLRAKEDEIEKIGKLNWALEEKVKSLCMENQIWRDLAQSNEATANALRSNLEQVLTAQVKEERALGAGLDDQAAALMDDAQSCCGSSGGDGAWRR
ncbi:hypothetical protein OIU85_002697 [Salix viminalis]|uniref:BOI-related E3 ubiquitin-protein ligase 3 n=1 Tax=Salix viminalis TaxID=40686 RepID=A0A9Q0ZZ51_SALVM|nr:hypothetical protein OIU85_002697 [Salix viminalis]